MAQGGPLRAAQDWLFPSWLQAPGWPSFCPGTPQPASGQHQCPGVPQLGVGARVGATRSQIAGLPERLTQIGSQARASCFLPHQRSSSVPIEGDINSPCGKETHRGTEMGHRLALGKEGSRLSRLLLSASLHVAVSLCRGPIGGGVLWPAIWEGVLRGALGRQICLEVKAAPPKGEEGLPGAASPA